MIYQKFFAKTEQAFAGNIKAILKSLCRDTRMEGNITRSITNLRTLKPFLDQHLEEEQLNALVDSFSYRFSGNFERF